MRSKHAVSLFIERRLKAFTRRSCSKVRISLANCLIYDRRFENDDDDHDHDTRPSFGFRVMRHRLCNYRFVERAFPFRRVHVYWQLVFQRDGLNYVGNDVSGIYQDFRRVGGGKPSSSSSLIIITSNKVVNG